MSDDRLMFLQGVMFSAAWLNYIKSVHFRVPKVQIPLLPSTLGSDQGIPFKAHYTLIIHHRLSVVPSSAEPSDVLQSSGCAGRQPALFLRDRTLRTLWISRELALSQLWMSKDVTSFKLWASRDIALSVLGMSGEFSLSKLWVSRGITSIESTASD